MRPLCFAVALWCGFVAAVAAQEVKSTPEAPLVSAKGQVVDAAGKPVAGARVVLREWSTIRYSDDAFQKDIRDILAETKTNAEGRFQFSDVASRPFRSHQQQVPWDVVSLVDGFAPAWTHLKAASDDQESTLTLQPAKSISGRLVDESGQPVVDCKVQVATVEALGSEWHTDFDDPTRLDLWRSQLGPTATTDKDGLFEIAGLPADKRLTLIFEHPDFATKNCFATTSDNPQSPIEQPTFTDGAQGMESVPVHLTGFTETLKRGSRVRGRVVLDDTGKPVPGAKVNANWQNRGYFGVADDDGRFEITGMMDPQYNVSTSTDLPGYLGAQVAVIFSDGDFQREVELRLPRGEMVRGSVADDETGAGVSGVGVRYVAAGADDQSGWSPAKVAMTDAAGHFEIAVPPGSGELQIYGGIERHPTHDVPDFWRLRQKKALSPNHIAKIEVVVGKNTDDVQLKVGRGLVIHGIVVDQKGKPVFAAEVRVRDRFNREELEKRTVTDDLGRFELGGFPPFEEKQIAVVDVEGGLRGEANVAADEAAGPSRVIDLGPIKLSATGRVVGVVLGDGKPLAGVTVWLHNELELSDKPQGSPVQLSAKTDQNGHFEFDTVDTSHRFFLMVNHDGFTDQGTATYPLKVGETVEIPAIELKSRSAFVAGIVVDPNGKPVPGATVSASERDGRSVSYGRGGAPKPTGPDGRFRLEDLPNVPLELLAYIQGPDNPKDRTIHFPAHVNVEPNQSDVRILLDPKLQRPLP